MWCTCFWFHSFNQEAWTEKNDMEMGRKEKCMRSKNTQNGDPTTLLSLPPYYDSAYHCLLLLVIVIIRSRRRFMCSCSQIFPEPSTPQAEKIASLLRSIPFACPVWTVWHRLTIQCRPISQLGDAAVEGQAASREVQLLQAQLQPHCGNLWYWKKTRNCGILKPARVELWSVQSYDC